MAAGTKDKKPPAYTANNVEADAPKRVRKTEAPKPPKKNKSKKTKKSKK